MNWYRVTFARAGRRDKSVELVGHTANDAVYCAAVKAGYANLDEGDDTDIKCIDVECIEDPEHARTASRLRQNARRGFADLSDRINEIIKKPDSEPKEDV